MASSNCRVSARARIRRTRCLGCQHSPRLEQSRSDNASSGRTGDLAAGGPGRSSHGASSLRQCGTTRRRCSRSRRGCRGGRNRRLAHSGHLLSALPVDRSPRQSFIQLDRPRDRRARARGVAPSWCRRRRGGELLRLPIRRENRRSPRPLPFPRSRVDARTVRRQRVRLGERPSLPRAPRVQKRRPLRPEQRLVAVPVVGQSLRLIVGVGAGSCFSSEDGTIAVPTAKNSITWDPQPWERSWSCTPTIPSA